MAVSKVKTGTAGDGGGGGEGRGERKGRRMKSGWGRGGEGWGIPGTLHSKRAVSVDGTPTINIAYVSNTQHE